MLTVQDIRDEFIRLKYEEELTGDGMLEIIGASFIADEPSIFGTPNEDYIRREIAWYDTGVPNIFHMEQPIPEIWKQVAGPDGEVNSQYGYLIHQERQFEHVIGELASNPQSRRGTIVYTRPTMHYDATWNGRNDFICTNAVGYFFRRGALHAVVQMRSNDVVFGYRNDYAWQKVVLERIAAVLEVPVGDIIWQAASLHVYPRHMDLVTEKETAND